MTANRFSLLQLPEADIMDNTVRIDCTFTTLHDTPRYCCEKHWTGCDGCTVSVTSSAPYLWALQMSLLI